MEVLSAGCSDQGDLAGEAAARHSGQKMNDSLDDIDIEALLNRPRPLGRTKRRPLYKAPEFTKRLNAFEECKVGEDVSFECHWKAFPKPEMRWFRDDEDITHNSHYKVKEADNGVLTLTIPRAVKKDEGAYRCRLENQEGSCSTTGYLTVTGDFSDKPLSARPRRNAERAVSLPPHLRSIREQKSIEEEEEEICSHMPPSPIQDFIDKATGKAGPNYLTWPLVSRAPPPDDNLQDSPDLERKVDIGPDSHDWKFTVPSREELRRRREVRAEQELMQRLDSVEKDESPEKDTEPQVTLMNGHFASSETDSPHVKQPSKASPVGEITSDIVNDTNIPHAEHSARSSPPSMTSTVERASASLSSSSVSAPCISSTSLISLAEKLTQSVVLEAISDRRCLSHSEAPPDDEEEIVICETVALAASRPPGVSDSPCLMNQLLPERLQAQAASPSDQPVLPSTIEHRTALECIQPRGIHLHNDLINDKRTEVRGAKDGVGVSREVLPLVKVAKPSVDLTPFPWLFYWAFTCAAALMGLASDMFPVWYILMVFFFSLLSFRFVVSIPSCT